MTMIRAKALHSQRWYVGSELKIINPGTENEVVRLVCTPDNGEPYEVLIDPTTIEYFGD